MNDWLEPRDVSCPYCGEPLTIEVDRSAGSQQYFEDCQVCCRPILLEIYIDAGGEIAGLAVKREDE